MSCTVRYKVCLCMQYPLPNQQISPTTSTLAPSICPPQLFPPIPPYMYVHVYYLYVTHAHTYVEGPYRSVQLYCCEVCLCMQYPLPNQKNDPPPKKTNATHTRTHTHTCTHACIHTYLHTYMHTHLHTYAHTHTCTHTCTHTYVHAHIHTHDTPPSPHLVRTLVMPSVIIIMQATPTKFHTPSSDQICLT